MINGSDDRNDAENEGPRPKAKAARRSVEMFNLADDPNERNDRAREDPRKVEELRARYEALARQAVPPKSGPKPPTFRSPRVWGEAD